MFERKGENSIEFNKRDWIFYESEKWDGKFGVIAKEMQVYDNK